MSKNKIYASNWPITVPGKGQRVGNISSADVPGRQKNEIYASIWEQVTVPSDEQLAYVQSVANVYRVGVQLGSMQHQGNQSNRNSSEYDPSTDRDLMLAYLGFPNTGASIPSATGTSAWTPEDNSE